MITSQPDFDILERGPVSEKFLERNIHTFKEAMVFIRNLPYGRNPDKNDLLTIFSDGCGTCSTKHALLKQLADENRFEGLQLFLGIFEMNPENSPSVKDTLKANKLAYVPEAYNYLRYKGQVIDCTRTAWNTGAIMEKIIEEAEIQPSQITTYKVALHKKFLTHWLLTNSDIPYDLAKIWEIREQCIADLAK